jgi:NAD(P)-dependent dehydrogenase (short-subunit alcohol dehydrogenase family)
LIEAKIAIVTGGGHGIGAAIAKKFVDSKWKCILLDTDYQSALSLQKTLGKSSVPLVIKCDVSSTNQVDAAFHIISSEFKAVNAIINNAGIVRPAPSHELIDNDWNELLNIHLGGTMRVSRGGLGLLLSGDEASIVNISSVSAALGFPGRLSYNAAKAGIEAVTRTLATEWGHLGIRVNAVAPGFILTDHSRELYETGIANIKSRAERTSLRRLGTPSEIAEVVFWLASPRSSYVTGQVIVADGGFLTDGRTGPDVTERSREAILENIKTQSQKYKAQNEPK